MVLKRIQRADCPQVISLLHMPWTMKPVALERKLLESGEVEIIRHIRRASSVRNPRRLFIEGLGLSLGMGIGPDPYSRAIEEALKRGWQVVGLDISSRLKAVQKPPPYSARQLFLMHEGRERDWPHVLHAHRVHSTDLVIMHPTHVPGFLKQSGFPASSVLWMHSALPLLSSKPLSEAQIADFMRTVEEQRMKRRKTRRSI